MDMRRPQGSIPVTTALVLGGSGFIGRHVVAALEARGCRVVVGSRHPRRRQRQARVPHAGYRSIRLERLLDAADWHDALRDCDVVVNCVGILRQRGHETYDRVHHRAPAALAAACRMRGLRLIHVSALGLDAGARSGFLRSKLDGETALRASGADWRIVRPSLLDGEGGFGARWIRRVAHWPLHVLPADAIGRIAALDVGDLGEAIARLALTAEPGENREYDLGGPHARTLAEHLAAMRALHTGTPALQLAIPAWLARFASHACDLLHVTPYSFGHWELLLRDNCPRHNRLSELLGRTPRDVGAAAPMPMPMPAPIGPGAIA
jgi:NADH dehydrogenase